MTEKRTILLIDDDPLVLMNHTDILEDAGYPVVTATSLREAANLAASRDFELIVCDHDLGDGKGLDFLKALIIAGCKTPAVYLSAAGAKILEEALALETVSQVLAKPVRKELLLEAVKNTVVTERTKNDKYPRLVGEAERNELLKSFI